MPIASRNAAQCSILQGGSRAARIVFGDYKMGNPFKRSGHILLYRFDFAVRQKQVRCPYGVLPYRHELAYEACRPVLYRYFSDVHVLVAILHVILVVILDMLAG